MFKFLNSYQISHTWHGHGFFAICRVLSHGFVLHFGTEKLLSLMFGLINKTQHIAPQAVQMLPRVFRMMFAIITCNKSRKKDQQIIVKVHLKVTEENQRSVRVWTKSLNEWLIMVLANKVRYFCLKKNIFSWKLRPTLNSIKNMYLATNGPRCPWTIWCLHNILRFTLLMFFTILKLVSIIGMMIPNDFMFFFMHRLIRGV